MALTAEQRELLRKRHGFAEWQGAGEGTSTPPVRGLELRGDELPGWELVKSRRNEALQPPRLDTFWRAKGDTADTLLGVQIVECPSVPAAREALLEAVGEFQSAAIQRRTDLGVGDVVFGQDLTLVFARGNLVAFVRNAGRHVVPVLGAARDLDAHMSRLVRGEGRQPR